jgi:beta-glucosidase
MKVSKLRSSTGVWFRDLNGNGTMEPYEDPTLPVPERVADLVSRMSLDEKAGLLFHPRPGKTARSRMRASTSVR